MCFMDKKRVAVAVLFAGGEGVGSVAGWLEKCGGGEGRGGDGRGGVRDDVHAFGGAGGEGEDRRAIGGG